MTDTPGTETAQPGKGQLSLLADEQDMPQYLSPVAICTLTDDDLRDRLSRRDELKGILVGALHTENLGIEQIITYILSNPNIRFLILCGFDGTKAVGHLPGQTFLSLARNGMDGAGRIIGAEGKRPVIKNITPEAVAHFRQTVEVMDLIGCSEDERVIEAAQACIQQNPGPAEPFRDAGNAFETIQGYVPDYMVSDPAGYFVITVDAQRRLLLMSHYANNGVLNMKLEGRTGPELYFPAIERGLISRLDHAAYLGRELYRAEYALRAGDEYIQDLSLAEQFSG